MEIKEILKRQDVKALKEAINSGIDISKVKSIDFIFEVEEIDFVFLQILIDNGVNINEKDEYGYLLFSCIFADNEEGKTIIRDKAFLKYFIEFIMKNNSLEKNFFEEILEEVVLLGEIEIIQIIVDSGADINEMPILLGVASLLVEVEIIELLFRNGANPNVKDEEENVFGMLVMMTEKLFKLGSFNLPKDEQSIRLEQFSNFEKNKKEIVQLFIDNGADVNALIDERLPILFMASLVGDLEIVELLLQNGANPNVKLGGKSLFGMLLMMIEKLFELMTFDMKEDMGTLFSNFEKNKFDIAKLFIKYGVDINKERLHDMPLLGFCTISQDFFSKRIEELKELNIEDREKSLRLMNSMNFGDIEVAKFLIEHGADVNIKYDDGNTFVYDACLMNNIPIVKLLCENEADVNQINEFGETILFHACSKNKVELVQILLDLGADVNTKSSSGFKNTALGVACQKENIEIVKLLIDAGVDVNANILGSSLCNAYSYGQNNREIKKLLLKNGINTDVEKLSTNKRDKSEDTEEIKKLKKEIEQGKFKRIEKYKSLQKTPMTEILKSKDTEALKKLLNKGYDVQYVNVIRLVKENYPLEFIELIVSENCQDINIQDNEGNTALMVASKMDNLDIVNMLLKYNPDINIKNKNNEEAWELTDNNKIIYRLLNFEDEIILNQPNKLVKLLTNFTIDTPIKYTTHLWDFGDIKKEYGSFQGFIEAISKQWKSIEKELRELSLNLHTKIYNFLLNESNEHSWCSRVDISIGWSSLDGLEAWCNEGNNPFEFRLKESYEVDNKTITTFGEIINLFKREIEIRNENNMLESIFLEEQKKLGRKFSVDLIKLKGRTFYTDVEKFQESIGRIFEEIKKRDEAHEIRVEVVEPNSEFIQLKITQLNSFAHRSAKEMLEEVDNGDFKILKENLTNLCDWSIESSYEKESYRVNYLRSLNIQEIEKPNFAVDGFTHILRFYKK